MTLKTLNPLLIEKYRVPEDVKGVLVESVDPRSNAAELFGRGDVITEVRYKSESVIVVTPQQIEEFVEKVRKKLPTNSNSDDSSEISENTILFLVNRQGNARFVPLNIDEKASSNDNSDEDVEKEKPKKRRKN
ncbi:MAG: hypothetical protein F9K49_08155 [Caedimonadaceae bacterium]|nr:MAG: hypothetical protein F9K49_08155 [Caedimonadaceae bacterium]